ncbi:hypothetical protein Goshw_020982 [Gossypium schwendimanii]|uniref:Transposase MuDR plant domain-containing protein n=1 Tax=Gossypium schwendimanii TaxID=34291 RepID=A0A7J9MDB0_GOSSC|nr:hypothetical protein [Gossypium schwendimanii]
MSSDDEYYFILHVGGHFIKDPYVRYVGVEVIRLKEDSYTISYFELCKIVKIGLGFNTIMLTYFNEPSAVRLQSNLTVIYDDTSTIAMLDVWVKFKEIELYVEHEVDNPIIADKNFLLTTGEGDVEEVEVDREGDDEGEVQADGEGVSTTGIEVDEDIGMESGGHISLGPTVGEDNYSEVAVNEYAGDFATSDRLDNVTDVRSGEEEGGNETEFKSAIRKYSKECRRQLKFIKNESKRVVVRCFASPNCPWRIRASYSLVAK